MKNIFLLAIIFLASTIYYDRECAELDYKYSYFTTDGVYCHKEFFDVPLNKPLREIYPYQYHVPAPNTVTF